MSEPLADPSTPPAADAGPKLPSDVSAALRGIRAQVGNVGRGTGDWWFNLAIKGLCDLAESQAAELAALRAQVGPFYPAESEAHQKSLLGQLAALRARVEALEADPPRIWPVDVDDLRPDGG